MTERNCMRIHQQFTEAMNARFEESKKDRDTLHKQTAGIFRELKIIRWGSLATAGSVIGYLAYALVSVSNNGGFAPATAMWELKTEIKALTTKFEQHEKISHTNQELLQLLRNTDIAREKTESLEARRKAITTPPPPGTLNKIPER